MNYHVLHPFTSMSKVDGKTQNLMIAQSAKGSWVLDQNGNHHYNISNAALSLGSAPQEILHEISRQYEKLSTGILIGQGHESAQKLADKLIDLFPNYGMVFYSNDGTGSIESAMKITRHHFLMRGQVKKKKFISLSGGYHGTSYGSLSLTHIGLHGLHGPVLDGCLEAPIPDIFHCTSSIEEEIEQKIAALESLINIENPETIAAIFIETIQSVSGIRIIPKEYLVKVREISKKNNILLVIDEVTTGLGRVGEWSASSLMDIEGDIITFSKGLTAGFFPLGATLLSHEIAEGFIGNNVGFPHGSTLAGHPVGCAIGLAIIEKITNENLIENVRKYGEVIRSELVHRLKSNPFFGEVRGEGLMIGLEFVGDKETREKAPISFQNLFIKNIQSKGLLALYANGILSLYPPFNISDIDADFIVETVSSSVNQAFNSYSTNKE